MNRLQQLITAGLPLLLGVMVFVFFAVYYPAHLLYQEQLQFFLLTSDYLSAQTAVPGGLAQYIGGFLTQFYYQPWVGALVLMVLLASLQRLELLLAEAFGGKQLLFVPFTFFPSLFYWMLLCDEHYLVSGVISLLGSLVAWLVYTRVVGRRLRLIYGVLMLPVLYWSLGGTYLLFAAGCLFWEVRQVRLLPEQAWGRGAIASSRLLVVGLVAGCVLLVVALPLLAKAYLVHYPLRWLWWGAGFYRFTTLYPGLIWFVWAMALGVPVCLRYLPSVVQPKKIAWLIVLQVVALTALSGYVIRAAADFRKEEVMQYDYYVRMQQWKEVIRLADRQAPISPLSVAGLNLALCQEGLLPDRMFHYYQNGAAGLLPDFDRDFTLPLIAGEVYYHLGFINTAQRFAFEGMEAIPDFQKSVRAVKRLAETNLINGHYSVAAKYLRMLQQTFYYKEWATDALACLGDEARMAANPEWARLRSCRTDTDFLFSEREKDMMLGILLQQHPDNRMVYEYLMAYCLLTKDLRHFLNYYPLGKEIAYTSIPLSYQEALIYIWGLTNSNPARGIPYAVSDGVKQRVQAYGTIYTGTQYAEPILQKQFADTYWYYLHFRK